MKYGKALKDFVYAGKRRHVGDVFPVRRMDYPIHVTLRNIEIVSNPAEELYQTTEMEAEKPKRKYTRKKVVKE